MSWSLTGHESKYYVVWPVTILCGTVFFERRACGVMNGIIQCNA